LAIKFLAEGENFVNYVASKPLSVNVWDGDSLLLLGTIDIDLSPLLRQGKEAVQLVEEYELVQPDVLLSSYFNTYNVLVLVS
jgi:nephrocystin-4